MYPRMLTTPMNARPRTSRPKKYRNITSESKETIELIPEKLTNKEKDPARESIMIVEDNKEMNDYLASIFSEKYDIIRAYNGAEACKKIAKQLPNLIISDLMMPVMDGMEFTERVKQDVTTSHIPVILRLQRLMRTTIRKVICVEPMHISPNLSTPRIWNCWYRISKRAGNRVSSTSNRQRN